MRTIESLWEHNYDNHWEPMRTTENLWEHNYYENHRELMGIYENRRELMET